LDELGFLSSLQGTNYDWHEHEADGELAVDVIQTNEEVIVQSAMAGANPDDIGLHLQNDLLTIRGRRVSYPLQNANEAHQEIYWGKFSRSIVLPCEVRYELAGATYKNGLLTIILPKRVADSKIKIMVIDD